MKKIFPLLACLLMVFNSGCSKDEEIRQPDDILGVWSPDGNSYFEYAENNSVYHLSIEYQDNESIGEWTRDVYYYEPGYNLVIYLSSEHEAAVYQIVEMNSESLTWCWVEDIDADTTESIGKLIGQIINEAQEGFNLNPELFETFKRIPKDKFLSILEDLNIQYPW